MFVSVSQTNAREIKPVCPSLFWPVCAEPCRAMNIKIVSTLDAGDAEVISDMQREYRILPDRRYVLSFTNGSTTMRAFKELMLQGRDVVFHVVNLEFFMYKMRLFKYCDFEFVDCMDDRAEQKVERYKSVETSLSGKFNERGIKLSFEPDVFASIRSSLARPDLYLSGDNLSTAIYRMLDKKTGYDELRESVWEDRKRHSGGADEEFDKHFDDALKSLVFSGIVKVRDEEFSRWG